MVWVLAVTETISYARTAGRLRAPVRGGFGVMTIAVAAGAIISSAGYLLAFTVVAACSLGAAVSLLRTEEATRDFDARDGQIAAESRARGY